MIWTKKTIMFYGGFPLLGSRDFMNIVKKSFKPNIKAMPNQVNTAYYESSIIMQITGFQSFSSWFGRGFCPLHSYRTDLLVGDMVLILLLQNDPMT